MTCPFEMNATAYLLDFGCHFIHVIHYGGDIDYCLLRLSSCGTRELAMKKKEYRMGKNEKGGRVNRFRGE